MQQKRKEVFSAVLLRRLAVYIPGIFTVCFGVVLCKKCAMGISPVSSIPYVLSLALPLSFGLLTMCFHLVNIAGQMVLRGRVSLRTALQILLAVVFSYVIDMFDSLIVLDSAVILYCVLALIGSVFFTALGMLMMFIADLVQNPVDGFVKDLAAKLEKPIGNVKVWYDISCVLISLGLSLLLLGKLKGFGVATIVSAVFVGKTLDWLRACAAALRNKK